MPSPLKSLSKIFTETIFRIPDYQRGYAWENKQLLDFWNDLEQLPKNKKHYTGVLTVEPVPKEVYLKWEDDLWLIESKRYEPLYIVDGQQRLTTIIILIQVLSESLKNDELFNYSSQSDISSKYLFEKKGNELSKSFIFGYEKDNPSYEYLKREIMNQSSEHSILEETFYTKNLLNAKRFFIEKIKELSFNEKENIFTKITQSLEFNIFYIEPDLDVFITFETMNNRGKPLSHLELLKTRLIYLTTKINTLEFNEINFLRKNINEAWKDMFHILGIVKNRSYNPNDLPISEDDTFLLIHYLYYFREELNKEIEESEDGRFRLFKLIRYDQFKDNLLNDKFSGRRIHNKDNQLNAKDILDYTNNIRTLSKVYCDVLSPNLSNWNDNVKIKLLQINRIGNFEEILLTIFIMNSEFISDDNKLNLLTLLEKMTFLRTFTRYYYEGMPDLPLLSIKLVTEKINANELISTFTSAINRITSSKSFEESLIKIGKNNKGFYGWRGIKYFFYEYEQYLKILMKENRDKLDWTEYSLENYDIDYRTIEHIYPTRANCKYWKENFKKYTTQEKNSLRQSLGNLLPLSSPKNSSLSNKGFDDKKLSYKYGCYSEISVSEYPDWNAVSITKRGIDLLKFMEKRWDMNLGTDTKKISYLGLSFVLKKESLK